MHTSYACSAPASSAVPKQSPANRPTYSNEPPRSSARATSMFANPHGQVHQTESKAAMNRRSPHDSASTTSMLINPPGRTLSLFPSPCPPYSQMRQNEEVNHGAHGAHGVHGDWEKRMNIRIRAPARADTPRNLPERLTIFRQNHWSTESFFWGSTSCTESRRAKRSYPPNLRALRVLRGKKSVVDHVRRKRPNARGNRVEHECGRPAPPAEGIVKFVISEARDGLMAESWMGESFLGVSMPALVRHRAFSAAHGGLPRGLILCALNGQ